MKYLLKSQFHTCFCFAFWQIQAKLEYKKNCKVEGDKTGSKRQFQLGHWVDNDRPENALNFYDDCSVAGVHQTVYMSLHPRSMQTPAPTS